MDITTLFPFVLCRLCPILGGSDLGRPESISATYLAGAPLKYSHYFALGRPKSDPPKMGQSLQRTHGNSVEISMFYNLFCLKTCDLESEMLRTKIIFSEPWVHFRRWSKIDLHLIWVSQSDPIREMFGDLALLMHEHGTPRYHGITINIPPP